MLNIRFWMVSIGKEPVFFIGTEQEVEERFKGTKVEINLLMVKRKDDGNNID